MLWGLKNKDISFSARDIIYAKRAYAIAIPSSQLGTGKTAGWLVGW